MSRNRNNRSTKARSTTTSFEALESRQLMSGGELDPTFGQGGIASLPSGGSFAQTAVDVAVQADGKTVVVGTQEFKDKNGYTTFFVARLNRDGKIDRTFNGQGFNATNFGHARHLTASAVAIQPDGKIVVVGTQEISDGGTLGLDYYNEFAVARYNADGTVDKSFDNDGFKTFRVKQDSHAEAVAIQADGKIVIAGDDRNGSTFLGESWEPNRDFAVVRLNPNGSFDGKFGFLGKTLVPMGFDESAHAVTIDYTGTPANNPNYGKIILAGTHHAYGRDNMVVARLNSNGRRDGTFDRIEGLSDTGYNIDQFPGRKHSVLNDVVMQPDGKIVVAGSAADDSDDSNQFALARYDANGKLDKSFGGRGTGFVETGFGGKDQAFKMVQSPNGQLIVGGVTNGKLALSAYDANGIHNGAFGNVGRVSVGPVGSASTVGLATAPDGRLLIAGGKDFTTARFFQEKSTIRIDAQRDGSEAQPRGGSVLITRDSAALPLRIYLNIGGSATLDQDYTTDLSSDRTMTRAVTRGLPLGGTKIGKIGGGIGGGGILGGGGVIEIPGVPYVDMAVGQKSVAVKINMIQDSVLEPVENVVFTVVPNLAYSIAPGLDSTEILIEDDDEVRINFQTANRFPPPGYAADLGTVFGDRGAGLNFGWDADNKANARSRGNAGSPDPRYDTFNDMQLGGADRKWEIAVPNGLYQVRLVAGDPIATDSVYKMNLEGKIALSATPSGDTRWFRSTNYVLVRDGRLTLSNAPGAVNNKIAFIDIKAAPIGAKVHAVALNLPVKLYSPATAGNWTKKPSGLFSDNQLDEALWA
jgi:uncharacterized delta-60 repeat protein